MYILNFKGSQRHVTYEIMLLKIYDISKDLFVQYYMSIRNNCQAAHNYHISKHNILSYKHTRHTFILFRDFKIII